MVEGNVELGPKKGFFVFVDGEHSGMLLGTHFGAETGYTSVGRLRISAERADVPPAGHGGF